VVSIILDTNSVIAYLNGDVEVARKIELIPELILPSVVIGEMVYGAMQSARREDNLNLLTQVSEFNNDDIRLSAHVQAAWRHASCPCFQIRHQRQHRMPALRDKQRDGSCRWPS